MVSLQPFIIYFGKLHISYNTLTINWASMRENLSLGFPKKRDSNQSPQLQRLAGIVKFSLKQVNI